MGLSWLCGRNFHKISAPRRCVVSTLSSSKNKSKHFSTIIDPEVQVRVNFGQILCLFFGRWHEGKQQFIKSENKGNKSVSLNSNKKRMHDFRTNLQCIRQMWNQQKDYFRETTKRARTNVSFMTTKLYVAAYINNYNNIKNDHFILIWKKGKRLGKIKF